MLARVSCLIQDGAYDASRCCRSYIFSMYVLMSQDEQLKNGDCGFPMFNQRTKAPVKPPSLLDYAATIGLVESTYELLRISTLHSVR